MKENKHEIILLTVEIEPKKFLEKKVTELEMDQTSLDLQEIFKDRHVIVRANGVPISFRNH